MSRPGNATSQLFPTDERSDVSELDSGRTVTLRGHELYVRRPVEIVDHPAERKPWSLPRRIVQHDVEGANGCIHSFVHPEQRGDS